MSSLQDALAQLRVSICRRWSEDIYQEVALRLLERPGLFVTSPHRYILRCCRRVAADIGRRQTRERHVYAEAEYCRNLTYEAPQLRRAIARQRLAQLDPRLIDDALGGQTLGVGRARRVRRKRLRDRAKMEELKR
jgi:DNA-directed RNA polymerase specialized sigma24 family protein